MRRAERRDATLRHVEFGGVIETPWSFALTAIFLATAILCALHLAQTRGAAAAPMNPHARHESAISTAVHVNHLVMSLAMLLMVWRPVGTAGTWVQVAIFTLFGALMLSGIFAEVSVSERISLSSHTSLNVTMIWMLLAMPMLMAHPRDGSGDVHAAHHGGASADPASIQTVTAPAWASGVNWAAIGVSGLVAVWWAVRLLREPGHRVHAACHLLMAAGMSLMLALM